MILELNSFEMLEKDLGGQQAVLSFGEYELSIISGDGAYANKNAPYEIAVFKGNGQVEMPGITEDGDTVKGFLTKDNVDVIIKKMYLLTGTSPRQI